MQEAVEFSAELCYNQEKRINKGMENILNYANRKSRGGNLDG